MPLVLPVGYYEAAFHHNLTGSLREAVCTLGLRYDGTDLEADIPDVQNAWANRVAPVLADVWAYTRFTLRQAAGTVYDNSFIVQGGTAHAAATPNVSFLVRKVNVYPGRKNRGRFYLPGVSEQDVDAVGLVAGSKITEINGALGTFYTDVLAANFSHFILHTSALAPTLVSSYAVQNLCATQRRRLRK